MFQKVRAYVVAGMLSLFALCVPLVQAQTDPVIAPELPTGFDFDVTILFSGLLGILLPAVAAAIGLAAAVWAVGLIWRKVRGVGV
jgi:hypothetical protein